ncbi:MAG: TM2 domain-containing protein [Staphylococcus epidermidis]|nr:TM2 domain-containing protein [Staphylococcus epidermidis]
MNLEEKSYIEQQVTNRGKSTAVSDVLGFFLGGFGAHRFYHGKGGSGVGLLVLTLLTVWFTFGIPTLIWAIIDAFLIPNWVREDEERIRQQALSEVKLMKNK